MSAPREQGFATANFGNLAAQVAHDPSGAARQLCSLEAENERLRAALTRIATLSMPYRDTARLSRHIAREALEASSEPRP